ncbi:MULTISPECIES: glycoside hydrolase family 27 protein [Xanthomonas]|uniref:Alpha-galactosidase n=1 Tax=Xanthomonas cucurbitae TaxID=56453 RepID=A0ABY7Y868_9XANT|nr:glycoside hydrolase family 27 protein [Xanthomonas cucurbitae]QHG89078.1 glycoside hydrolase family 27 protein [Xanthomonas cucurbitae]WDM66174.1 glycoside hydrolase family 27 protein [Xanthomonas cucurbitae]WDM70052.1 glycoside hydrolase family 27 protein [Xanthomonas cucurbitae]WDM77153.1 glycoside hydrolase family 27 protein [Xanthomonas cucurbitae]
MSTARICRPGESSRLQRRGRVSPVSTRHLRLLRAAVVTTLLVIAVVLTAGCHGQVGAATAPAAQAPATALEGIWILGDGPSFPGARLLRIERRDGQLQGSITTDWYGDLPMNQLRIVDGVAQFQIDNGNARLPPLPWVASVRDGQLRVSGRIWHTEVDVVGRRGSAADAQRLAFHSAPLPPLQRLAPDGQARTPPMGWSSWNRFGDKIDAATIRAIADALVSSGLRDAGYRYVNIDDGWQGERDAAGVLHPNARFPDMRALADYVHARGLKLGLYSSPGPKTCAGYIGSYGHVEQDAATWAGWGIDYLKYDLCSGEGIFRSADTRRRAYQQMGQALRATGRPMVYSLCQYGRDSVGRWGREVGGHLWRTTGDIEDHYASMARIGFDSNGNPDDAGPGGWNDPDMLEIGNGGMQEEEYRTHMSLWALSAAPLLLGNDLRAMSPATLRLLRNQDVLAIDQDPLGRQGRAVRKADGIELWSKSLADGRVALGVFNRGTQARDVTFTPADAGLAHIAQVRDLWRGRRLGPSTRSVRVAAHGVVLLALRP